MLSLFLSLSFSHFSLSSSALLLASSIHFDRCPPNLGLFFIFPFLFLPPPHRDRPDIASIMEPSYPSSGGGRQPPLPSPPKKELPLQGPRPAPLRVSKQSHAVQKPPRPHQLPHPAASSSWAPRPTHLPPPPPAGAGADRQKPTIIFDISPKVIHVEERNFMSIVQQLTGSSSTSSSGDVSPAARVAAIERTSPTGREKGFAAAEMGGPSAVASDDELMCMLGDVQLAQSQGILTPAAPPAISAGFFSPATEPHMLQDLSPFWPANNSYNSPSASTWFTAFSPSPTASVDLFNLFDY